MLTPNIRCSQPQRALLILQEQFTTWLTPFQEQRGQSKTQYAALEALLPKAAGVLLSKLPVFLEHVQYERTLVSGKLYTDKITGLSDYLIRRKVQPMPEGEVELDTAHHVICGVFRAWLNHSAKPMEFEPCKEQQRLTHHTVPLLKSASPSGTRAANYGVQDENMAERFVVNLLSLKSLKGAG